MLRRTSLGALAIFAVIALLASPTGANATSGVAPVPQGIQSDKAYAQSFAKNAVRNVMATTQRTSCYTPEAPFFTTDSPYGGYDGMTACEGSATTGEGQGPYATQANSNPGYPASTAML